MLRQRKSWSSSSGRGRLEGKNLAALRIDSGHHVLDGAVFSGRIHGLKDQQQAPAVVGVELVLQFGHAGHALGQELFGVLLGVQLGGVGGIVVLEPEFLAVLYPVWLGKLVGPAHCETSWMKDPMPASAAPARPRQILHGLKAVQDDAVGRSGTASVCHFTAGSFQFLVSSLRPVCKDHEPQRA